MLWGLKRENTNRMAGPWTDSLLRSGLKSKIPIGQIELLYDIESEELLYYAFNGFSCIKFSVLLLSRVLLFFCIGSIFEMFLLSSIENENF